MQTANRKYGYTPTFKTWLISACFLTPFAVVAVVLSVICAHDFLPWARGVNTEGHIVSRSKNAVPAFRDANANFRYRNSVRYTFSGGGLQHYAVRGTTIDGYADLKPGIKIYVRYFPRIPDFNYVLGTEIEPPQLGLVALTALWDLLFALPLLAVFGYPVYRAVCFVAAPVVRAVSGDKR